MISIILWDRQVKPCDFYNFMGHVIFIILCDRQIKKHVTLTLLGLLGKKKNLVIMTFFVSVCETVAFTCTSVGHKEGPCSHGLGCGELLRKRIWRHTCTKST